MAGKGSAPGEHRGGRKAGTPNKSTLARAAEIAAEHRAANLPLAVEVLENAMLNALKMAVKFELKPGLVEVTDKEGNKSMKESIVGDEVLYGKYLDKTIIAAGKLAPYQTPQLQSTTLNVERLDLTRLSDAELAILERIYAKADDQRSVGGGTGATQH